MKLKSKYRILVMCLVVVGVSISCKKESDPCSRVDDKGVKYEFELVVEKPEIGDTLGMWSSSSIDHLKDYSFSSSRILHTIISDAGGYVILNDALTEDDYYSTDLGQGSKSIEMDFGSVEYVDVCQGEMNEEIGTKELRGFWEEPRLEITGVSTYPESAMVSCLDTVSATTQSITITFDSPHDWIVTERKHGNSISPSSGSASENNSITFHLSDNSKSSTIEQYIIEFTDREQNNGRSYIIYQKAGS